MVVTLEELEKAINNIMKDSNDLESAKTIFKAFVLDNYYIVTGRVNIVKVAMKCILEYLMNPRNSNITEIRRENIKLKVIEKSHKEENGKLRVKLTKQEKMIEYMVNWINDHEDPFEGCHENEKCGDDYISCEQCIKQYFEKKAKESE